MPARARDLREGGVATAAGPQYAAAVITRLEIENFKAIRKLAIDLNPLTVLVGPNDSGKSTILQALELISRSVAAPVDESPWWSQGPAVELLGASQHDAPLSFAVAGTTSESTYRYELQFSAAGRSLELRAERLTLGAEDLFGGVSAKLWAMAGHGDRTRLSDPAPSDPRLAVIRNELSAFLVAIEPRALSIPCGPHQELQSNGLGLVSLVDKLLTDIDRTARDRYDRALARFSPNITNVGVRVVAGTSNKELMFGLLGNKAVPAREVSTGLLASAVYVALENLPHARFLVEEPENGLHPRAMRLITDVLRGLADAGRQVVMTTHSPILLNYMDAEDVRVVTRDADGVHVKPITETAHFDERTRDFELGELWYAVGEDALVSSAS